MKHNRNATFTVRVPVTEPGAAGQTIRCNNLTHRSDSTVASPGTLEPVKQLKMIAGVPARPLGRTILPDNSRALLLCSDTADENGISRLFLLHAANLREIHQTHAEIYCAVPQPDGWLVMTSEGRVVVAMTQPEWWIAEPQALTPPEISLRTVDKGSVTASLPALTLPDCDLSRQNASLSAKSAAALSSALIDTYSRLCLKADENAAWTQPTLVRLHLIDSLGQRIFSTGPQIVGPGWQLTDTITVDASASGSTLDLPATALTASIYALEVTLLSLGAYAGLTDSIEIEITPQFHPVDPGASVPYRIARPATASPALTFAMPGATASLANNDAARARTLSLVAERMDCCAATLQKLSPLTDVTRAVTNSSRESLSAEIAAINRALTRNASTSSDPTLPGHLISAPNSFIARSVTRCADTVVWADITPLYAPAALPPAMITGPVCEWTGNIRLTMTDGSVMDTLIGYPQAIPIALPPLISFTDPDVAKLEIWVKRIEDESVTYASARLAPMSDGRGAIFISPDLKPLPLSPADAASFPPPASTAQSFGPRMPGALVTASSVSPGFATGLTQITTAPVVALHPAVRSLSSWDFSRCRLYAFSPEGTFAVAIGSGRTAPVASLIDPRAVLHSHLTCYTSAGVAAVTDTGQLLMVSGARAEVLDATSAATSLAWDAQARRLWALESEKCISAYDLTANSTARHSLLPPHRLQSLHTLSGEPFVVTSSSLMIPDSICAELTPVKWQARVPLQRASRARLLDVALAAAYFEGEISLRTDGGAGPDHSLPLLSLAVKGEVNHPIVTPVFGIARRYLNLSVSGMASPDFSISAASITLKSIS